MAKILLVEDDAAILDSVAFSLKRDGHEVLTADNGVAGLARARQDEPDLVILDLMLPRMSGVDVCRLIREERDVPILMLTARDSEADKVRGFDVGADDYVTKPFSMRELVARVSAMLRRSSGSHAKENGAAAAAEQLDGGRIVLNIRGHEALLDGRPVPLRPREFDLLEYLMRHPGQVLPRERILEAVWGYTFTGGTRTVDVHIRWLREKFEEEPSQPRQLLTVRGVGYKFVP